MNSLDQSLQDILNKLKSLDGKKLRTFRGEEFRVSIRGCELFVVIQSTGKSRHIDIKREIIPTYRYLNGGNIIKGIGSGKASIRELGFSEANPAYVWGILSNFNDVQTDNNKLHIKNTLI
jgi:hypothetical protein